MGHAQPLSPSGGGDSVILREVVELDSSPPLSCARIPFDSAENGMFHGSLPPRRSPAYSPAGAGDPVVLLGTEGQAAALYFSQFGRMLKVFAPGREFDFRTRNRRPPRDPVNALLSFAYA